MLSSNEASLPWSPDSEGNSRHGSLKLYLRESSRIWQPSYSCESQVELPIRVGLNLSIIIDEIWVTSDPCLRHNFHLLAERRQEIKEEILLIISCIMDIQHVSLNRTFLHQGRQVYIIFNIYNSILMLQLPIKTGWKATGVWYNLWEGLVLHSTVCCLDTWHIQTTFTDVSDDPSISYPIISVTTPCRHSFHQSQVIPLGHQCPLCDYPQVHPLGD